MRNYLKMHGMDFGNANNLPTYIEHEEDAAFGSIEEWSLMLHPEEASVTGNWIKNIADGTFSVPRSGNMTLGQFPNGRASVRSAEGAVLNYLATAYINPNEWSVVAVIDPAPNTAEGVPGPQRLIKSDVTSDALGIHIGWTRVGLDRFIVYENLEEGSGNPVRLEYTPNFSERQGPFLVMVTFSTREGLRIIENGQMVAAAPDDRRPLEVGTSGVNNLRIMQNTRGDFGPIGIVNADLGQAARAGDRVAIERFMREKYQIPWN